MAKKRYVHKTVRPSDGGRLLTATAEETVGISNYVEKLNFRRDLDGEIRREGWSPFGVHKQIGEGDGDVDLLHEFTDHLGSPRVVVSYKGSIYSYKYTDSLGYFANTPKTEAKIAITGVDSSGGITDVSIDDRGYGYPNSSYLAVTAPNGNGAQFSISIVGSYVDSVSITNAGSGYSTGSIDSNGEPTDQQYLTISIERYEVDGFVENTSSSPESWTEIASGLHYLGDGVDGVRRWECVESNGYAIFNNSYDLPLIYRSDWDKAYPLYGLRENKVASVGTIQSYDGRLLCADIVEVGEGFDIVREYDTYGCVYDMPAFGTDVKTRRNQYSVMWSAYGEPWLFNQSQSGRIYKNSAEFRFDHEDFAINGDGTTFSVGDPVYITGAGINGGRLSLKHDGNAVVVGITGQPISDTFTKINHGFSDGDRVRVVTISKGSGPIEGADYYVEVVDEDKFRLNRRHVRPAKATETLNGNTLSFTVTDFGAGYTVAPTVSVGGYSSVGNVPQAKINSVGQVVSIADNTGYTLIPTEQQSVTIAPPNGDRVDIVSYIEGMILIKPDLTDKYLSIIDGAVSQVSKVGISRDYGGTPPASTISYKVSINNESYELKYNPSLTTEQDFPVDATSEILSNLFASAINEKSVECNATSTGDGITLTAKIAGSGFDVNAETTDTEAEVSSAITTANSTSGSTDAQIDEAYVNLYGTERDSDENASFNNPISILDINGPTSVLYVQRGLLPTPTSSGVNSTLIYRITFELTEGGVTTYPYIDYDFSAHYNGHNYPVSGDDDYHEDMPASAFLVGLVRAIAAHPTLSGKIKATANGYTVRSQGQSISYGEPYAFLASAKPGGDVGIHKITYGGSDFLPQDDLFLNLAANSTFVSAAAGSTTAFYYLNSLISSSAFLVDNSNPNWIYLTTDRNGQAINGFQGTGWVTVSRSLKQSGTAAENGHDYFVDGIFQYKPTTYFGRKVLLDAYADTENNSAQLRRSVSLAGATILDISLGSGYQDWQEDGTSIIKMETIGEHLACYRENGYFTMSQTDLVDNPFTFKTRYVGRNVPTFRHCILKIGGKRHVYAGNSGIHEVSLSQPQPVPSVLLAGATEFWRDISEEESEYVFTSNNVLTSEYFIHLPDGYKSGSNIHTIAYDYKQGSISQIDASFTAAYSIRQPSSALNPAPNDLADFIYVLALPSGNGKHTLVKYGIDAPVGGDAPVYTYSRTDGDGVVTYPESRIRFGLIAFGDTFNEKDMRSYILHGSDVEAEVQVEVYTAYTTAATSGEKYLFGEENDPSTAWVLSDLKDENAIPLYLRAPLFQDVIKVTGDQGNIKIMGRTFEVAGIYDRAAMQMVGIGGTVSDSS